MTRAELLSSIASVLADTGSDQITPADVRTVLNAIANSTLIPETDGAPAAASHTHAISDTTGLQAALDDKVDVVEGKQLSTEDYTSSEKTKLAGIAAGATVNATDAALRDRATHTGAQAIATITGLQTALDLLASLASPALTGNPTAPTQLVTDDSTKLATTAHVKLVVAALIGSSPSALDSLAELAGALGNDPNFATTISTLIGQKLAKSANLSDLTDAAAARGNLNLGSAALEDASAFEVAGAVAALALTLAAVATTGAYSDLSGKPTLGTAAALDVAAAGNAAAGEVVKGNDTRLSDVRTPTAHAHAATDISDSTAVGRSVVTAADAAAARAAIGATGYANSDVLAYLLSILGDGEYLKRAGSDLAGDTPAGGGGGGQSVISLMDANTFTNLPVSSGFWASSVGWQYGAKMDLSDYTEVRFVVFKTSVAGAAGSKLALRYNTSFSTSAGAYSDIGTSAVEVAVDVSNTVLDTGWIALATGAKADVIIMLIGYGGDGVTDPTFGRITAQFR